MMEFDLDMEEAMKTVQIRETKAPIEAAEAGQSSILTRHVKPAMDVVPLVEAEKLYSRARPGFGDFLLTFPSGVEFEEAVDRMWDVDL